MLVNGLGNFALIAYADWILVHCEQLPEPGGLERLASLR